MYFTSTSTTHLIVSTSEIIQIFSPQHIPSFLSTIPFKPCPTISFLRPSSFQTPSYIYSPIRLRNVPTKNYCKFYKALSKEMCLILISIYPCTLFLLTLYDFIFPIALISLDYYPFYFHPISNKPFIKPSIPTNQSLTF